MLFQMAGRIVTAQINFFCTYGPPQILHSDQGRNFESTILTQVLQAFGIRKSRTTPYHPQGDGMVEHFNRTLLQLLRAYVASQSDWETYLPQVLYMPIAQHVTAVQEFLRIYYCMVEIHLHCKGSPSLLTIRFLTLQ